MCSDFKERAQIHSTYRLLLIEDADDIQKIIQLGLELIAGFQVIVIKPDEDWLVLAQYQTPDVILLDMLPCGSDILGELCNGELTHHIPVVCIVSRDRTQDQIEAKIQGAAAVIAKPFDLYALAEIVSEILVQSPKS